MSDASLLLSLRTAAPTSERDSSAADAATPSVAIDMIAASQSDSITNSATTTAVVAAPTAPTAAPTRMQTRARVASDVGRVLPARRTFLAAYSYSDDEAEAEGGDDAADEDDEEMGRVSRSRSGRASTRTSSSHAGACLQRVLCFSPFLFEFM